MRRDAAGAESHAASGVGYEPPGAAYTGPTETSGKAIGSLICGLLFFFFPVAIVAIILGHISLSEIRRAGGRLTGRGLAIGGLVLGYAGVSFIPVLIIAAIAIPNLLRAKMAANEASAIGSLGRSKQPPSHIRVNMATAIRHALRIWAGCEAAAGAATTHI